MVKSWSVPQEQTCSGGGTGSTQTAVKKMTGIKNNNVCISQIYSKQSNEKAKKQLKQTLDVAYYLIY